MSETATAPEKVDEDLFAEEPEPTEPADHAEAEATKPEPEAEEKPPKQPTLYVVLIGSDAEKAGLEEASAGEVIFEPITDASEDDGLRKFQGFRREEVLQELLDSDLVMVDDDGFTTPTAIVPARSFVTLRGKVETRRRVVKA